ncbi:MAG: hypothetical protein J0J01_21220 [Reyranella sp.]|uniref:hypothetical protein n=1 Tax=Reyranella sp. TaxID=1929291 RepID=UPI001AC51FEC|nr:hypothetical protein [Reyranella sp.]MBN9089439.1 hypothetical protein [Reyranella sp.]
MMRSLLATILAWLFLSSATMAETGLERFEREIKPQIELKSFTYKGAEALGDTGFVLNEVVAVMPANATTGDKDSTLKIDKVTVEALDFERMKKLNDDDMPRFAKIKLEGMSGDEDMFALLEPYGIPRVPMDVVLDYRLDGVQKVFTLNALEIALRGQGKIALTLVIDGVSAKSSEMAGAKDDGKLRTASLTLDDKGLIGKLLPAIAKEQGQSAEGFVAFALVSIAAFCEGQGPATLKALDAVASFVNDWQGPKGALVLGLKPAKTAGLSDLDKVMEPNALVDIFGLSASYPGTRDGAAKAGPASK